MAVVNIPVGGQSVGIEIPDFALEATQRDIYDQTQQQLAALQAIQAGITGQSGELDKIARETGKPKNQDVVSGLKENTKETTSTGKKIVDGVRGLGRVIAKEQSASGMISGTLGAIPIRGFAETGAVLGTLVGVMEKFGEATQKAARIGVGLGNEMDALSDQAGRMGLTFDQLSSIALTYGANLRSLGNTTADGYAALEDLVLGFKEATYEQGYFGLANSEITQLMLEEIELRRRSMGQAEFQNLTTSELTNSFVELMRQSTALARITGEDVHAQIAARRQAQENVVVQGLLADASEEGRQKLLQFVQSMSQMGPAGTQMALDMLSSLETGIDLAVANPELYSAIGQPARDLLDFIRREYENDSVSMEEFSARMLQQQGMFTRDITNNIGEDQLEAFTFLGGPLAQISEAILQMSRTGRRFDLDEDLNSTLQELNRVLSSQEPGAAGGMTAAGISADAEALSASIHTALRTAAQQILGDGTATGANALRSALTGLADFINDIVSDFAEDPIIKRIARTDPRDYENPVEEVPLSFSANTFVPGPDSPTLPDPTAPESTPVEPTLPIPTAPESTPVEPTLPIPTAPESTPVEPTLPIPSARETEQPDTTATPISYSPSEFEDAILRAFERMMANGGLPVNVRNWNQIPRRSPSESSMT